MPMADFSRLVWHPYSQHGNTGLFGTLEQAAGWMKKERKHARWCCHVMRVGCAKFQSQSLTLADFNLWLRQPG